MIKHASLAGLGEAAPMSRRRFLIGMAVAGMAGIAVPWPSYALLPRGGAMGGLQFAVNRPAGLTTIIDRQWNPTDGTIPGGVLPPSSLTGTDSYHMQWFAGSPSQAPLIATPASLTSTIGQAIPALPDANPTCLAVYYPSGFTAGAVPFGLSYTGSFSLPCQKLYIAAWILMPSNFRSNGNNIKWINIQNTAPVSNHLLMLNAWDNTTDGRSNWLVLQGGGTPGYYGGGQLPSNPNPAGALTSLGYPPGSGIGWWGSNYNVWTLSESYVQAESNPGVSSDGIFWSAMDGVIINQWNNIRFNAASGDSNGFNLIQFDPYYGGGGSAAPGAEYLCMGRFLAAGA